MTDQTTTVETLQNDVTKISDDLAEAKKLTDETLKKSKAEAALLKVEATKTSIEKAKTEANTKLEALKGKTDEVSKTEIAKLEKEIKEYEEMLKTLDTSKIELTTLKAGITDKDVTLPSPNKEKTSDKKDEKPEDKDKSRLRKQWDGVTSTEERKTNTWWNIARVVWGIGIVAIGVRGIKKLFGLGKKDEEKKEGSTTEKKWFRQTGRGKALKFVGFWWGAYYLVHGLVTGRRWFSDFFNRDKKEKINPDDLKSRYEKEVPEALKPKYDKFAGMVDDYRKAAGNTETLWKLECKEGTDVEIPKWAIPAAMDNAYDNVGDILDTSWDIMDKRGRVGQKLRGLVTECWGKLVGGLLRWATGLVKGLTSEMFDSNGEPNDKFKERAEKDDLTRDEQVANLFQKYSMVTSYLNDKRKQLTRKYTIEQLKTEGISNPTEDQIEDYELNKDMVEMRVERDFLNKKIASLETESSAVDALETEGVLDATVSVETQAVLDEVKTIKKEIVPEETIWTRAKASADINKDEALKTELNGISTRFGAHLKEGILERNILEKVANLRGILNLDELRNSKADDLEEAMEKLWFADEVKKYTLQNNEFYSKLQSGTLTKADIEAFEATINGYFSLLQQVMLETQTQQENESAWEFRTRVFGRLYKLTMTPEWWAIIAVGYVNSRWTKRFPKAKTTPVKRAYNTTSKPVKRLLRKPVRMVNVPTILGNRMLRNLCYGNTETWYNNFMKDFERWKISYDDANFVYTRKIKQEGNVRKKANNSDLFESLISEKYSFTKEQMQIMRPYFNNKNVRRILNDGTTDIVSLVKKLKSYDDAVEALTDAEKSKAIRRLFKNCKFNQLSDIDNIFKNMDTIDGEALAKLSDKEMKAMGESISELTTAEKINAKIKELKTATNTTTNTAEVLTDIQKACETKLTKEVDILKDQLKGAVDTEKLAIEDNIKKLQGIVDDIKNFPEADAKAMKKLLDTWMDIKHISRVLSVDDPADLLKRIDQVKDVTEFEKELKLSKMDDFVEELKNVKKLDKFYEEIKPFASKLDDVLELVKEGKTFAKALKIISKIPVVG